MKRSYLYLLLNRPMAIMLLVGIEFIFLGNLKSSDVLILISVILSAILISIIGYILLKVKEGISLYTQFALDVILSSVILYLTGGIESPYFILYFINIIVSSIFLFARGSFIISAISIGLFVITVFLRSKFRIFVPESFLIFSSSIPSEVIFIRSYTYSLSFFMVGALSAYVSERFIQGKRNLQEIKITLNDIISGIKNAIITMDKNGYIKYVNRFAGDFIKDGEILNRKYNEILKPDLLSKIGEINDSISQDRKFEMEVKEQFYDVNINTIQDRNNEILGYNLIIFDITDKKRNIAKEKEFERLQIISHLSAAITHEIGNPLASIKGATEVVLSDMGKDDERRKLLGLILKESGRLNDIVNKFRYISRKNWVEEVKPLELIENLKYIIDILEHNKLFRNINIDFNCKYNSIIVKGADELKEVFTNIIHNAAQSMDYTGDINIQCKEEGNTVVISIKDNGKGINNKMVKDIFKPYFSMKKGGLGLGLTISKQIMDEIGGKIDIVSIPKEGTVVTLTLRLENEDSYT